MTRCADVELLLPGYLTGTLSAAQVDAFEAHASECDLCAAMLEQQTRLPLNLPTGIAPPPSVRSLVLNRISRSTAQRSRRWWLPIAAAAAVVVATSLLLSPARNGQQRTGGAAPAELAAQRADVQLRQLDAARDELRAALDRSPGNTRLLQSLDRLDEQREAMLGLVKAFES